MIILETHSFVFRNSDITTLNPLFIVEGCIADAPTCYVILLLVFQYINFWYIPQREFNTGEAGD